MARIIDDPNRVLGSALCKALGIDKSDVYGIEIRLFVNEVASVKISRYIKDVETQQLIKSFSEYELRLKE